VEFGKTEISYLNVQDHDRQRAVALASSVAKQLELALRRLARFEGPEHGR